MADMYRRGIIRDNSSPWRSPVLLIKKTDENGVASYRFCVDLRKVNEVTVKDAYSLPRIDEAIDALNGSSFFLLWISTARFGRWASKRRTNARLRS